MFLNKNVRLYHPEEVEAMRKVLRKLGKYARKDVVQKEMWAALREVRLGLVNGNTEQQDHNNGN